MDKVVTGTDALLARHRLDVDDYYRMADAGILGPDERVELIDGEIIDMAPIGIAHASVVGRITRALVMACGDRAHVWVQNPIRLDEFNQPQPDFAVLRPRADFYAAQHPGPADVLLLVEVADSSLRYDREVKLPIYARAGIPEVWIVDLRHRALKTYWSPSGARFAQEGRYAPGDAPRLVSAPDITVHANELLGEPQVA